MGHSTSITMNTITFCSCAPNHVEENFYEWLILCNSSFTPHLFECAYNMITRCTPNRNKKGVLNQVALFKRGVVSLYAPHAHSI